MNTRTKCHIKAVKDLVEMMSIGGIVAIAADIVWIILDLSLVGCSRPGLFFVLGGLVIAFSLSAYGLYHYHKGSVKEILKDTLVDKIAINKAKQRHKRKS